MVTNALKKSPDYFKRMLERSGWPARLLLYVELKRGDQGRMEAHYTCDACKKECVTQIDKLKRRKNKMELKCGACLKKRKPN
ncbi:hypothetical protein SAMN04488042_101241 [Shimia aestuarii]|uniref:Uncharacterized protein n=1 Tax=Shimia aestuarii TaxID=254406 RepID=A0A1I4HSY2_9RHOB|nr:hypothetical protein SAMN04488042_101241 [Shimia aestuarii]